MTTMTNDAEASSDSVTACDAVGDPRQDDDADVATLYSSVSCLPLLCPFHTVPGHAFPQGASCSLILVSHANSTLPFSDAIVSSSITTVHINTDNPPGPASQLHPDQPVLGGIHPCTPTRPHTTLLSLFPCILPPLSANFASNSPAVQAPLSLVPALLLVSYKFGS